MPSRGQNGGAMNESFAQHSAQTPSPATGSRQATHSVGSAMSSASRDESRNTPRHAFSAPRRWVEMERDGDASASMRARLAPRVSRLKRHLLPLPACGNVLHHPIRSDGEDRNLDIVGLTGADRLNS